MYAVVNTGGKQSRAAVGDFLDVELLGSAQGEEVRLTPVLLVDGDEVVADAEALSRATVTGTVVGVTKGPKITGFTYKPKTRQRRRYGHRQRYTTVEVTAIEAATPAKG